MSFKNFQKKLKYLFLLDTEHTVRVKAHDDTKDVLFINSLYLSTQNTLYNTMDF